MFFVLGDFLHYNNTQHSIASPHFKKNFIMDILFFDHMTCGTLIPQPRIESRSLVVRQQSPLDCQEIPYYGHLKIYAKQLYYNKN